MIFWAELLCGLFMNLWGSVLPAIGGLLGWSTPTVNDLFAASQVLPPITGIIAVCGVFCLADTNNRRVRPILLKLGVILEVLFRFRIAARAMGIVLEYPALFWISRHLLFSVVVCGVFFACAARLHVCGDSVRPRRIRIAGLSLASANIVTTFGTAYLRQVFDVDGTFFDAVDWVLYGVIGIWALCTFRSASAALRFLLEGQCVGCGYTLYSLGTPRCPECGTEFTPLGSGSADHESQSE